MTEHDGQPGTDRPALADELMNSGRAAAAGGMLTEAWQHCAALADLGRHTGDVAALADAATLLRPQHHSPLTARIHALCAEAMTRLDALDPVRAARVRAQFVATMDPADERRSHLGSDFLGAAGSDESTDDHELQFLRLQARYSLTQHPSQVNERLILGEAAVDLGRRTSVPEYTCWGHRWRMDGFAMLGARVDVTAERTALTSVARASGSAAWETFATLTMASEHHLEGRFAEAAETVGRAVEVAGPDGEVAFFGTVYEFAIARLTGEGLDKTLRAVSLLTDSLPFLAKAWTCRLLMAMDQRAEADLLWGAVATHLDRLSPQLPEWLVATAGNADVCAWLDDQPRAEQLYEALLPYEHLHVHGAHTPYDGPVALPLGRLARTLGRTATAQAHFQTALRMSVEVHSPPYSCISHLELADVLSSTEPKAARRQVAEAVRLAHRLQMRPTALRAAELEAQLTTRPPLTPRETEILQLVASDLTNKDIAQCLVLSERTVEAHVSHLLRKLGADSRVGLAVWKTEHPTDGSSYH